MKGRARHKDLIGVAGLRTDRFAQALRVAYGHGPFRWLCRWSFPVLLRRTCPVALLPEE